MTAEQLGELLGKVTQGEWVAVAAGQADDLNEVVTYSPFASVANAEGYNATLISLAPSLARKVIAAEKMAKLLEEGECPWIEDTKNYREWWKERASALTAYREASK